MEPPQRSRERSAHTTATLVVHGPPHHDHSPQQSKEDVDDTENDGKTKTKVKNSTDSTPEVSTTLSTRTKTSGEHGCKKGIVSFGN